MNTAMQLDFTSQLDYLWALLPEAVLATGAVILLLYDGFLGRDARDSRAVGWGGLLFIALAAAANVWLMGVEAVGATGMVAIDGFRILGVNRKADDGASLCSRKVSMRLPTRSALVVTLRA